MKLPSIEFPMSSARDLRGRSHLPLTFRRILKVLDDSYSPKVTVEINRRDGVLVLWLILRNSEGIICDIFEETPDLKKTRRFFEMQGIDPHELETDVQVLMGWMVQLQ